MRCDHGWANCLWQKGYFTEKQQEEIRLSRNVAQCNYTVSALDYQHDDNNNPLLVTAKMAELLTIICISANRPDISENEKLVDIRKVLMKASKNK